MEKYVDLIIKLALKAKKRDEIPVGCIIVKNKKIIAKSYNNRQKKHSVLGHAEIRSILRAERKVKDWRLDGCDMYVTLEPCEMCSIIIREARINKVYYLIENMNLIEKYKENYIKINNFDKKKEKYLTFFQQYFKSKRK